MIYKELVPNPEDSIMCVKVGIPNTLLGKFVVFQIAS